MSEEIDIHENNQPKKKQTIKILAILSWIYIGITIIGLLGSIFQGQMSEEELEFEKAELLSTMTPESVEMFGKEFFQESIRILEVANENFAVMTLLNVIVVIIGLYGVIEMFNLRKRGYYFYIGYSLLPIIISYSFFGTGLLVNLGAIFTLVFSILFLILYGYQLKNMS